MICIYDKKTLKGYFNNNGLAILNECTKCEITKELNGDYSLELKYPIESHKAKYFEKYNIIKISDGQLFRIFKTEVEYKRDKIITVWAKHIFYDLAYYFIENQSVVNGSIKTALAKCLTGDPSTIYTYDSDIVIGSSIDFKEQNPVDAIFKIIDVWGQGELVRDNYDIKVLKAMGYDNGVSIRQGKNIDAVKIIKDSTEIITYLYPKGNNNVTLTEKYISVPNWNGEEYPPFPIVKEVDFNADDEPTLRAMAKEKAKSIGLERVTIEIDMVELSKTTEYKQFSSLETVDIGDMVTLLHKELDINVKVPVIK